jgi:tripartite-type tricarboxylate transporter receptor subunit TctC
MDNTDLNRVLASSGTVGIGSTPQQLDAAIREDYERYGRIIADLKLALD